MHPPGFELPNVVTYDHISRIAGLEGRNANRYATDAFVVWSCYLFLKGFDVSFICRGSRVVVWSLLVKLPTSRKKY